MEPFYFEFNFLVLKSNSLIFPPGSMFLLKTKTYHIKSLWYRIYKFSYRPLCDKLISIIVTTNVTQGGKCIQPTRPLRPVAATGGCRRCHARRGPGVKEGGDDWSSGRGVWGGMNIHRSGDLMNRRTYREAHTSSSRR